MIVVTESGIINGHGGPVLEAPKPPLTHLADLTGRHAVAKFKPIPELTPEQVERFWAKVEVHHPAGCWTWTAAHKMSKAGYGTCYIRLKPFLAHRVAYTLLIGPIPHGLTLDHLCRNRLCVNPDHLQPVSIATNSLRGYGPAALNATKTHCAHGHEFTPENTYRAPDGKRGCRTCRHRLSNAARSRRKGWPAGPKTHCKRGHEFTPENTYRNPNKPNERYCRACIRIREQEYIRPSQRQKERAV